ncbi:MAG: LysM peptidoglycan-binding domain-containing protein [Actinomycetota bacterium]|nr:LysM peptidoglycan-binding domain-containing protein [Actinomycetota bacterium]
MAAVRHLEVRPADRPAPTRRHLRLVSQPVPPRSRRPLPAATYRRRRLVVGLAVGLAAVAAVRGLTSGEGDVATRAGDVVVEDAVRLHVVQPGDTYWSIASSLGGAGDIRGAVDELSAANGDRPLQVGDRVSLPG